MIKGLLLSAALLYSIPTLAPQDNVDIGYTQKLMRWEIVADAQLVPRGEPTYYEPFVVEATGYSNPHGNPTYSGEETIEGITIAGKKEWIGSLVALYSMDENGNIGEFFGYREVTDTGYGHNSILYPGKGTIETGETVDIYWENVGDAWDWGSRQVYIQVIPGKG